MNSWHSLCTESRFKTDGELAVVTFDSGRKHRVRVLETQDLFELHALVAGAAAVRDVANLRLRLWRHNRSSQLVSFRVDARGRVCSEGWVPKAGLTAAEFQFALHRVAAESDRLEFLLTGRDVE